MAKPKKKPWLAGLLSLLLTGMGQIYNREYGKGIFIFILGLVCSTLMFTGYWIGSLLGFLIVIYAVYDAYTTAKRTVHQKPYKNAIWITAIIFIVIFMGYFWAGFWAGFYSTELPSTLIKDERMVLHSDEIYYYGGTYETPEETITYHYMIESSQPVNIYIVPSKSDYELLRLNEEFIHYPTCQGIQTLKYDRECTISSEGGIAIVNKNPVDAIFDIKVYVGS